MALPLVASMSLPDLNKFPPSSRSSTVDKEAVESYQETLRGRDIRGKHSGAQSFIKSDVKEFAAKELLVLTEGECEEMPQGQDPLITSQLRVLSEPAVKATYPGQETSHGTDPEMEPVFEEDTKLARNGK